MLPPRASVQRFPCRRSRQNAGRIQRRQRRILRTHQQRNLGASEHDGVAPVVPQARDDALEHFDLRTAELLLLDLDVPGDRIRNDLSRLAELNPNVRIIGVTERSEGSEIAVRERLDGVAEKPFALGNLISFVHELLRNQSTWKEFRYLAPMTPGLHVRASHRPHRVLDYPAAYSGWGINE